MSLMLWKAILRYLKDNPASFFVIGFAMLLTDSMLVLILVGEQAYGLAENLAVYAYLSIVIAVVLQILTSVVRRKDNRTQKG